MNLQRLKSGTKLTNDIYSASGVLLLKSGTSLTDSHIELLHKHHIFYIPPSSAEPSFNRSEELYNESMRWIEQHFLNAVEKGFLQKESTVKLEALQSELRKELKKDDVFLAFILTLKPADSYLFKHSLNVGLLASKIGELLGLDEEQQVRLAKMGLFHDIGKLKVPSSIVNKPGRLSEEEYELMKKHTVYGYEMLEKSALGQDFCLSALFHHERLNGEGYPNGIPGENIPLLIQILSIADTFDAICSNRVYQSGKSSLYAVEELLSDAKKGKLNQKAVTVFSAYLIEQEKDRVLTLKNGKKARIVHVPRETPNQPVLLLDDKEPLDLKKAGFTLRQIVNV